MAIILRHVHTCPSCNQTWECVCWKCDYLEELRCSFCTQEQEGHRPTADRSAYGQESLIQGHILDRVFDRFVV